MQELRGLPVAKKMAEQATALVEELKGKGIMPKLAVVRVGEREDDLSYERGLMKKFENVGALAATDIRLIQPKMTANESKRLIIFFVRF